MVNKSVYLIEILGVEPGDKWIPMYEPCYTLIDALKKAAIKIKIFGKSRVRIGFYVRDDIEVRI